VTEKIRTKLDEEMMLKWERYVYKEVTNGSKRDFRHIDEIIREKAFLKAYLNKYLSVWVFILCDGEYGVFDGYTWYEYIPKSLAVFMGKDVLNMLQSNEFKEFDGRFFLDTGTLMKE